MNFLEQLTAEWYAFQGFFVSTNIHFGKRDRGGWDGEMDVVVIDPKTKTLTHVETSSDANSWDERVEYMQKKFKNAAAHYNSVIGFDFEKVVKIAVVSLSKPKKPVAFGNDIELVIIPDFIAQITKAMKKRDPVNDAIPETYPLLRAIQFAARWG